MRKEPGPCRSGRATPSEVSQGEWQQPHGLRGNNGWRWGGQGWKLRSVREMTYLAGNPVGSLDYHKRW